MSSGEKILTAAARMALSAALHGDFRGFGSAIADLENSGTPAHQAWRIALESMRWSFEPFAARPPTIGGVGRLIGAPLELREAGVRTCVIAERVAIATLDGDRLGEWIHLHAELIDPNDATAEDSDDPALGLDSARLWYRLLTGTGPVGPSDEEAKSLQDKAARRGAGAQVIEAAVARAIMALSHGAIEDAVDLARQALRMAQAEAQPSCEYLAGLTLARVRRYSGRPHLALHILSALRRAAPPFWAGWIGWEILLAGGEPADSVGDFLSPSANARDALARVLDTARDGDEAAFAIASSALRGSSAIWPDMARETDALLSTLDPGGQVTEATAHWIRGDTATIPCGLHGIGIPRCVGAEIEGATAFVIASPSTPGRRFLRPGLALAASARLLTRDSAKSSAAGVRTETGVAALALAGRAGISRQEFFRRVYGFPFVAQRHQAVLDVLCHRARQLVGTSGDVRRYSSEEDADGSTRPALALDLREAIVVPDMRCALPAADRVLRALATLGATSASAASDALRMPLRTVQSVLQKLVTEGACSTERDGRHIVYRIEDTTFTQVTPL